MINLHKYFGLIFLLLCPLGHGQSFENVPAVETKMSICNAKAIAAALKRDDRKAFMSQCLRAPPEGGYSELEVMRMAQSRTTTTEGFIAAISSVQVVKERLRSVIIEIRACPSGSCLSAAGAEICAYVGALDVRVDYSITATDTSRRNPIIPISDEDIRLMKLIFSQCKATNYRHQDRSAVLQVVYAPTQVADAQISDLLGIERDK